MQESAHLFFIELACVVANAAEVKIKQTTRNTFLYQRKDVKRKDVKRKDVKKEGMPKKRHTLLFLLLM